MVFFIIIYLIEKFQDYVLRITLVIVYYITRSAQIALSSSLSRKYVVLHTVLLPKFANKVLNLFRLLSKIPSNFADYYTEFNLVMLFLHDITHKIVHDD